MEQEVISFRKCKRKLKDVKYIIENRKEREDKYIIENRKES